MRRVLIILVVTLLAAQGQARAGWERFGEVALMGGRATNPEMVDPESLEGDQTVGSLDLKFGALMRERKTRFHVLYAPEGEYYAGSQVVRALHLLETVWHQTFTPRNGLRFSDTFAYTPESAGAFGVSPLTPIVSGGGIAANDLRATWAARPGPLTQLDVSYDDHFAKFDAPDLLDSSVRGGAIDLTRRAGPRGAALVGYSMMFGRFQDESPGTDILPPPPDPNAPPVPLPDEEGVERLESRLQTAYAGYRYGGPRGHAELVAGVDAVTFTTGDLEDDSALMIRSSVGWNAHRFSGRLGYRQGIDNGGGNFAHSLASSAEAGVGFRISEAASLDLSASQSLREELGNADDEEPGTVETWRRRGQVRYRLDGGWSLLMAVTHDAQESVDVAPSLPSVRSTRYEAGFSYSFGNPLAGQEPARAAEEEEKEGNSGRSATRDE